MLEASETRATPASPAASSATNVASTFVPKTSRGVPMVGAGIAARWMSASGRAAFMSRPIAAGSRTSASDHRAPVPAELCRRRAAIDGVHLVPVREQVGHDVTPDPAGRARHQDPHQVSPPSASINPCM